MAKLPSAAGCAAPVTAQVELVGLGHGEDVVLERVVVREPYHRAQRHDGHPWHELLVAGRDVERFGTRRDGQATLEVHDRIAEIGGRFVALLKDGDVPADLNPCPPRGS